VRFTVYTSSSDAVDPRYAEVVADVGRRIAKRGDELVYGGTALGLMGVLAEAVRSGGGRVTGVLPQLMADQGYADEACDDLVVTADMGDRKRVMIEKADAFVALPGGFGTLEELLEVLTLKQLGYHSAPIVLLQVDGFWDRLLAFFDQLYADRFAKPVYAQLYHVAASVDDLFHHVDTYEVPLLPTKWF
jgi:cytokinin riboside 5'-monophosphate phosphoribohydrolase